MPRGFGRLTFLTRRSASSDRGASDRATMVATPLNPDVAPVGPPVLLPASIVRQVLFDATELTPVWARPRPDPRSAAVAAEPAVPKRVRRAPKAGAAKASGAAKAGSTKPAPTKATPRRTRQSNRSPKGDA